LASHPPSRPRRSSVTSPLARIEIDSKRAPVFPCPGCDTPLDIHQPDSDAPEILLGVCPDCGQWVAIGVEAEGTGALVVSLPGVAQLRSALNLDGSRADSDVSLGR